MITITDSASSLNRRAFLTIGSLGLGGLSLSSLLSAKALASQPNSLLKSKSVIFLFQQGGPSQLETFDPKPNATEATRTVTGVTRTATPGILFGEKMAQLAKLAKQFTIVRSFQTNNGGHNIRPLVGPESLEANIGSYYSRVAGSTNPDTGMPTNAVLFPQAVSTEVTKGKARGNLSSTGPLGKTYAPFTPGAGGQLQKDMQLNISSDRFHDRRTLLKQLDKLNRQLDEDKLENLDEMQKQAYEMLLSGGVAEALDLSREDSKTLAAYDTSRFVQSHNWDKVNRGKKGFYTGHAKSLGKLLLLARRLCEAGCGFVTIHASYDGVWDMHADRNNLNMKDGMEAVGPSFDHAVSAFIRDTKARGLQDKIMLVATGEMGRTPKINKRGGRDHWSRLAPLLLYGGGIQGGQVIGQSTKDGGQPATNNLTPKHLISTILRSMIDIGELRIVGDAPQVVELGQHDPIPDTVG